MLHQAHVRDFAVLDGPREILILIAIDLDAHALNEMRGYIQRHIPLGVAWRCVLSSDLDRDESVFRLGGLAAVQPLLEEDGP